MLNRKREKREKERKQDRFTICCKTCVTGSLFWRVSSGCKIPSTCGGKALQRDKHTGLVGAQDAKVGTNVVE